MQKKLGAKGEEIAAKFLESKGYEILNRNFRFGHGEIDIVARKNDTIVFVEVKTRVSNRFGSPEESVTLKKQRQIRKIAEAYLQFVNPEFSECRFDVIAISYKGKKVVINHIENAFL